jgi:hypothetical protein
VEAVLAVPLTVALCLSILQLALVEHAKLMTEYAAYVAARAGAVWNGSNERMHDAAMLALLPTMGRTGSLGELGATYAAARRLDGALGALSLGMPRGDLPAGFRSENLLGRVRVDTVSPARFPELDRAWKLPSGAAWQELDFDGADSFVPARDADRHFAQAQTGADDEAEAALRGATRLSIRVRYFYELRIPLASWVIFTSWYAAMAGARLFGALDRPSIAPANVVSGDGNLSSLEGQAKPMRHERGFDSVSQEDMELLWRLATAGAPGVGRRIFFPLTGTETTRMQSNFYRKWVMHERPAWGP